MTEPFALAAIAATFLLGGTVKGVIGFGLPTVTLGILAVAFDLPTAMALLVVPALVTNLWQASTGGHGRAVLHRIWPFLVAVTATVWIGTLALAAVDTRWLLGLLGLLLVLYAALHLAGVRWQLAPRRAVWAGPVLGAVNGVLAGMTGAFVVPGALYLQAIGLSAAALVQAMGMLFAVCTLALGVSLGGQGLLTPELRLISLVALVPALIGMAAGQRLRLRLPEDRFRRLFFTGLLLLGAVIVARAAL